MTAQGSNGEKRVETGSGLQVEVKGRVGSKCKVFSNIMGIYLFVVLRETLDPQLPVVSRTFYVNIITSV